MRNVAISKNNQKILKENGTYVSFLKGVEYNCVPSNNGKWLVQGNTGISILLDDMFLKEFFNLKY